MGRNATLSSQNAYFDVTFYTDPTVIGVVLVRGEQLDGRFKVVYVGDYAAGAVVGTDTIAGQVVDQHSEAALPADRPPTNTNAAPGMGHLEDPPRNRPEIHRVHGYPIRHRGRERMYSWSTIPVLRA